MQQKLGGGNSNFFYFHPYLGKIPNLTSIFFRWVGSTTNQKRLIYNYEIPTLTNQSCKKTSTMTPRSSFEGASRDDVFLGAKKTTSNLGFKQHPDLEDVGIYVYIYIY